MTKKDIQQGVRVCLPAPIPTNETRVHLLQEVLANWHYPHPYLAISEPYTREDNVRLRMVGSFPGFCVESFNAADLEIYQPTPPAASLATERAE